MSRLALTLAGLVMLLAGCGDERGRSWSSPLCDSVVDLCDPSLAVAQPSLSAPVQVVPSPLMPAGVESQLAHNNLDVAVHEGRLFVAFRTAPFHFASADTVMYLVSSADLVSWRFEGSVALGTDLREPQLLSLDGMLLFYFVVLGTNPVDFEPQGVKVMRYQGPGRWTAPSDVFEPGFLVWRIKAAEGGGARALGYVGGENVYDNDGQPIHVQWLSSADGLAWDPVVPGREFVLEGGVSETDLAFVPDGGLVAVGRNEAGDSSGFGSKVCRAEPDALADWRCAHDPRKYDSPLMFTHRGVPYLIARRHVTDTGHYDLGLGELPLDERFRRYQLDYWSKPKRCALWRVDPEALKVSHLLDLPSRGDTCFPEIVRLNATQYLVFNYTSPLDGEDVGWSSGQGGPTQIYYLVLTMP